MTEQQIVLVQRTWKILRDIDAGLVGDVFYTRLFMEMPSTRRMFKIPMTEQNKKLIDMIGIIVARLDRPDEIIPGIRQMAIRHVGYGVKPVHYQAVGNALLWTLEQGLGIDWNEQVKEAWMACYKLLSDTMISASDY